MSKSLSTKITILKGIFLAEFHDEPPTADTIVDGFNAANDVYESDSIYEALDELHAEGLIEAVPGDAWTATIKGKEKLWENCTDGMLSMTLQCEGRMNERMMRAMREMYLAATDEALGTPQIEVIKADSMEEVLEQLRKKLGGE